MTAWAAVAKAVAPSLISGLFGSKKAKVQGVDYQKLRDDAEAAGFNPLTALLAGGGAGYQREFNPELASGSFIAEAVSRGLDTYFNTPTQSDMEAEVIRQSDIIRSVNEGRQVQSLPSNFGYSLADTTPFYAQSRVGEPEFGNSPAQKSIAQKPDASPDIKRCAGALPPPGWRSLAKTEDAMYSETNIAPDAVIGAPCPARLAPISAPSEPTSRVSR